MPGRRGPKISPEVKELIMNEALKSTKKRTELAVELGETIEAKGWHSPTVETMEKLISKIRNDRDSQDRPWSVAALADYEIPPEALPVVMNAWSKALGQETPLTIRQVKWIARLYYFLRNKSTDSLIEQALEYARRERILRLTKAYPDKPGDAWQLWFSDAITYLHATGDDSMLRRCIESMKWQSTTDIAAVKAKLNMKEAQNE